jgi:hypothetical protein
MPIGLHRIYGAHHLHFITFSCYQRLPLLGTARSRDRFLAILEHTRQRYRFVVVGYVVAIIFLTDYWIFGHYKLWFANELWISKYLLDV